MLIIDEKGQKQRPWGRCIGALINLGNLELLNSIVYQYIETYIDIFVEE